MKRGLSVLVALAMLLALAVPALAEAASGVWSEISIVGAWTPAVGESAGELLTPAEVGIDFYMEILGDGTCEIMRNGQSTTAVWLRNGSIVIVQDDFYGIQRFELMEDGTLRAELGIQTLTLVHEGAAEAEKAVTDSES